MEDDKKMTVESLEVNTSDNITRDTGGRFTPGVSGNPSGRPKIPEEFRELAQTHSIDALKTVVEILQNPNTKDADRLRAADMILDRALGKPPQYSDIEVAGDLAQNLIQVVLNGDLDRWAQ